MGAFIHSRPLILHYSGRSVIYAGANDGMLHAFDAGSGQELWAFIPPDLLPKLKNLTGNSIEFFVDGSPKAYIGPDGKSHFLWGTAGWKPLFRSGGYRSYQPRNACGRSIQASADYAEMGQTWSSPLLGKIQYGVG